MELSSFHILFMYNWHIQACFDIQGGFNMAVMHIGAPACGMNAVVRSFVRNCIYRGDTVLGIHDGVEGLIAGNIKPMGWYP